MSDDEVLQNLIRTRGAEVRPDFDGHLCEFPVLAEGWDKRLKSLGEQIKRSSSVIECNWDLLAKKRWEFDANKQWILPIRPNSRCWVCGGSTELERHHKTPLEFGGSNDRSNLVLLCQICHDVLTEYEAYFSKPARTYLRNFLRGGGPPAY